jgi:pSer/pThr/pTyr-binding forkhead associated (FHA) protein
VSDAQLSILNYALLALLYLFFARVLWAVWSEVRGPRLRNAPGAMARANAGAPADSTTPAPRPAAPAPKKGKRSTLLKKGVPTKLIVLEPKVRKGSAYPIGTEVTLGRADSCVIGLPDDTFASQLHSRVFVRDNEMWVEDLGSTNGTHLNGARISAPMQLSAGDRLQVGSTIFEAQ